LKKFIITVLLLMTGAEAHAISGSAGVMGYYAFWNPVWKDFYQDIGTDSSFLYGPVLGLNLPYNFTASVIFLTNYGTEFDYEFKKKLAGDDYTIKFNQTLRRYDLDSSIGYSLSKMFKIFGGVKYLNLSLPFSDVSNSIKTKDSNGKEISINNMYFQGVGPAFGCGLSYPLPIKNLYLSATMNYLLIYSQMQLSFEQTNTAAKLYYGSTNTAIKDYIANGGNSTIGLSYYIESIKAAVMAGYRFQYLYYTKLDDDPYKINGNRDMYHGATFYLVKFF